jgi:hypothetical protein
LTVPARGDEPDRQSFDRAETAVGKEPTESAPWASTGGTAELRAQRDAFHDQFEANWQECAGGRITPDLWLESERFLLAADQACCATPKERAAAVRLSLVRVKIIRSVVQKQFGAGNYNQADMRQVENQLRKVELMEKEDQGR